MSTAALPPSAQGWPGAKHPAESGADFPHPGLDCLLVTQPTQKSDWGPLIQDGQVNIAGSGGTNGPHESKRGCTTATITLTSRYQAQETSASIA